MTPGQGRNPRPGAWYKPGPSPTVEELSLAHAHRHYIDGHLEVEQLEDLVGWILHGGNFFTHQRPTGPPDPPMRVSPGQLDWARVPDR